MCEKLIEFHKFIWSDIKLQGNAVQGVLASSLNNNNKKLNFKCVVIIDQAPKHK